MPLWNHALRLIDRISAPKTVHAHCDVPCGIYTPDGAQLGAETVETMITKMQALTLPDGNTDLATRQTYENTVARMIATKEQHAEIVKHEVTVLWGDYFKQQHLEQFPDLHTHVWNTLKQASQCKQTVDLEAARKLRRMVDQIADWFYESKGQTNPRLQQEKTEPLVLNKPGE